MRYVDNLYSVIGYNEVDSVRGKNCVDLNDSMYFYDDFDYYINDIKSEWLSLKGYYTTMPLGKSYKECVDNLFTKLYPPISNDI